MFFSEQLVSDEDRRSYETITSEFAQFINDCVRYLRDVYIVCDREAGKSPAYHHLTVLMQTRHVMEMLDGVGVLAGKGCAEPCVPLVRSAFEAYLGILYLLEMDSERRGLAYQVEHAHKQIKLYRKLDPNQQSGKEFRQELQSDPICKDMPFPPLDYPKLIANLESMFHRAEFVPIERDWKSTKKELGRDPDWYSLFRGPKNIRGLSKHLGHVGWYEHLYRGWSDAVHAGSGMKKVSRSCGGAVAVEPLRHPAGLQFLLMLAGFFSREITAKLLETYSWARKADFQKRFADTLVQRWRRYCGPPIITVNTC